jgi:hypothetical protein
MATRIIERRECDLTGEPDAQPVRFSLDGKAFVIDLAPRLANDLRAGLAPFAAAARRTVTPAPSRKHAAARRAFSTRPQIAVEPPAPEPAPAAGRLNKEQGQACRRWAQGKGMPVKDRGKLADTVVTAWREAGSPA